MWKQWLLPEPEGNPNGSVWRPPCQTEPGFSFFLGNRWFHGCQQFACMARALNGLSSGTLAKSYRHRIGIIVRLVDRVSRFFT